MLPVARQILNIMSWSSTGRSGRRKRGGGWEHGVLSAWPRACKMILRSCDMVAE